MIGLSRRDKSRLYIRILGLDKLHCAIEILNYLQNDTLFQPSTISKNCASFNCVIPKEIAFSNLEPASSPKTK